MRMRNAKNRIVGFTVGVIFALLSCVPAQSAQLVTEGPSVGCQEFNLRRELKIYKDPTIFLSNLGQIYSDPASGWEALMEENPLLTTVTGTVHLMLLGPAREFKNFGAIAKLYEVAEPKLKPQVPQEGKGNHEGRTAMIFPIKVCGDSYADTLGFVLESDLKAAQQAEGMDDSSMPPSTYPNPIPKLKK